ncbi:hypothetical protein MYCTH_2109422 [Thermothelomyces thermophilus ATCC 42464]|uniref:Heterokaryon incompatibility domain-containing protein n=1 Tax=Thermothelomyces thermophilus (strain ATCC 42464 / BCRC 31852 / DSM 1799) TaxID=573729 RepID=G2Q7U4_THET4|nr:uncharacterized protein MYCTH_2109422 [Thermothelomyces thermophilus ATCC 42464]AEO56953.1 hypothetical protein MYCTH_2109422 [Thermothelomyces thermophilus ATCC 42464]
MSRGFSAVMDRARLRLDQCLKRHAGCSPSADSLLPTRVLDLDSADPNSISLRESQAERARYICLSYCWGRSEFLKTTRESPECHKRGISLAELPQSFYDAVRIVRALGVRYFWIDSLCIIQNDVDDADWKRESGRMADVFRTSYLTVALTWAVSANDGCFAPPVYRETHIAPFAMELVPHFSQQATVKNSSHFPVLARGWVYQECMLSPRILQFGRQERLWECRGHRTCECGQASNSVSEMSKDKFHEVTFDDDDYVQCLWRRMVVEHSNLQLTYPTDRPHALSGLAEEVRRHTKQEYMAGHRRNTLVQDMCWYRPERPQHTTAVRSRPAKADLVLGIG